MTSKNHGKKSMSSSTNLNMVATPISDEYMDTDGVPLIGNLNPTDPVIKLLAKSSTAIVKSNETVYYALAAMTAAKRSSSIAIDPIDSSLQGIFTERDFIREVLELNLDPSTTLISTAMTPLNKLICVKKSETIKNCREIMLKNRIRHLPVMDENSNKCIGVISMTQLIRSIQKQTVARETSEFFGDSLFDIELKTKERANELALESPGTAKQDLVRTGYILTAAIAGATLLSQDFVRDNEYLVMSLIFSLGYIGKICQHLIILYSTNFIHNVI